MTFVLAFHSQYFWLIFYIPFVGKCKITGTSLVTQLKIFKFPLRKLINGLNDLKLAFATCVESKIGFAAIKLDDKASTKRRGWL